MEHVSIFEKSYQEIQKLKKELNTCNTITVDFGKLDSRTAGILKETLGNVLFRRSSEVLTIISGVAKEDCNK